MTTETEIAHRVRAKSGFGLIRLREGSREHQQLVPYTVSTLAAREQPASPKRDGLLLGGAVAQKTVRLPLVTSA